MLRSKALAASNEAKDIALILAGIKNKTKTGLKLIQAFQTKFQKTILDARERTGGSRNTHYDFEILLDTGEWKRVEHKGSLQYKPIQPNEKPWLQSVQFHNGGCEKYSVCKQYAQLWYSYYYPTHRLRSMFDIVSPTPSFQEWYEKDCKTQGNPKTAFGLELKKKVREKGMSSLLAQRAPILEQFILTEENSKTLQSEVLQVLNHALEQKDYWLTIHGNLEEDFYVEWYPQFLLTQIQDVKVVKEEDLWFHFKCEEGLCFKAILRWGKGAGFSNLRLDAR